MLTRVGWVVLTEEQWRNKRGSAVSHSEDRSSLLPIDRDTTN